MSARAILRLLLSGETLSPKAIAMKLDIAPQTARNNINFLYQTGHLERVGYGKYKISELGKEIIDRLLNPSHDPSSEEKANE